MYFSVFYIEKFTIYAYGIRHHRIHRLASLTSTSLYRDVSKAYGISILDMATVIHIDNASKSKKAKKAKKSKSKWSRDEDGHAPSEDGHPTSNGDARSVYETLEAGRRAHCYEGKPFSDYNGYSSTATDTFRRTTNKTVLFQDRKQSSDDKVKCAV